MQTRTIALLTSLALSAPLSGYQTGAQPPPTKSAASILIRGGVLVDGTGAPRRPADLRIIGTNIAAIGRLSPRRGERVINAHGMVIAPGFIDTHSHVDGGLMEMPLAETHIRQGITTSVVGQDGGSHFPLATYFHDLAARHVALNIASFVGHGTVRSQVMGANYKRVATPEEVAKMQTLVDSEMKAGGLGLSSGLEYDPGYYSTTAELVALARVAGVHGGLYISHVRDEGDQAFKSFQELIRISRDGHLPAQISHIKLDTSPVWGKAPNALDLMSSARKEGRDISADVYPYTYWQSTIIVLIPTRDWEDRAAWQKGLAEVGGPAHVLLSSYSPDPTWAGKTIAQICAVTKKDPISVIQDIVHHTHSPGAHGSESVVVAAMTENDLRHFVAAPKVMFCTDGGIRGTHPRGAGSFPRVLARYVRESHLLTLEGAIRKMTGLPAWRMGFHDRGILKVGNKADIVLFNPWTVLDTATTAQPLAPPVGLPYVFVNGIPVLDNGQMSGQRPGMVLRHPDKNPGYHG